MNADTSVDSPPRLAIVGAVIALIVIAAGVAIAALYSGRLTPAESTPLLVTVIGVVTTTVSALLSAGYAKRADQAIRNGVVVEKAKQGAREAIQEEQVLTRNGPVASTELAGLAEVLRVVHELRAQEPWDGIERRRRVVVPPPDPPPPADPVEGPLDPPPTYHG